MELINLATRIRVAVLLMMVVPVMISLPASAETPNASVTGLVKTTSGEPVNGALVKIRNEALGLSFMVVSQEQGRYTILNLPPGKYSIQAFGGTSQSQPPEMVEISAARPGKMDIVLGIPLTIPPPTKRMTDEDFEKLMPEAEEAGFKGIVVTICKECHSLERIVSSRKSPEKWAETVERMRNNLLGHRQPVWYAFKDDDFAGGRLRTMIKEYLAKNFGLDKPQDPNVVAQWRMLAGSPAHPNRNLPGALLKGAAAKYVAMEFSLPPGSMPQGIAVDSKGIAWISESNTGMLGRFDPNSLTYTRIPSPSGKDSKFQLNSVAVDPQDDIWFVDEGPSSRILKYNPKSREFQNYPIPGYRWPVPDIGAARISALRFLDGKVWGTRTTAQRILELDPSTGEVEEHSVPRGSGPFGLAIGADNMIWYAAQVFNAVVRLDPRTGRLTPYIVPTPRSDLRGMAADAEGNLWVAATESGKLVKIDGRNGKIVEFTPPTEDSGPYSVDVDTKRNLVWFSETFNDRIARFDPGSNSFVEFPQPSADSDVRRIEIDHSRPNRIWWAGAHSNKIGYIEVAE